MAVCRGLGGRAGRGESADRRRGDAVRAAPGGATSRGPRPAGVRGRRAAACGSHTAARASGRVARTAPGSTPDPVTRRSRLRVPHLVGAAEAAAGAWWKIVVPIVAALAIAGGGVAAYLALGGEDEAEAATALVLEPVASVGQDPFTESAVPPEDADVELPAEADLPQEILDRLGGSVEGADPAVIAALIEELLRGLNPAAGSATDFDLADLDLPTGSPGQTPGVSGCSARPLRRHPAPERLRQGPAGRVPPC